MTASSETIKHRWLQASSPRQINCLTTRDAEAHLTTVPVPDSPESGIPIATSISKCCDTLEIQMSRGRGWCELQRKSVSLERDLLNPVLKHFGIGILSSYAQGCGIL